jgi:hypothetical protein
MIIMIGNDSNKYFDILLIRRLLLHKKGLPAIRLDREDYFLEMIQFLTCYFINKIIPPIKINTIKNGRASQIISTRGYNKSIKRQEARPTTISKARISIPIILTIIFTIKVDKYILRSKFFGYSLLSLFQG